MDLSHKSLLIFQKIFTRTLIELMMDSYKKKKKKVGDQYLVIHFFRLKWTSHISVVWV